MRSACDYAVETQFLNRIFHDSLKIILAFTMSVISEERIEKLSVLDSP